MKAKYVNPFTDFGFKKIFGEEASKLLLIDFLNTLLSQESQIKDLPFKNTEQLGQKELDRKAIFDIYCENDKGEKFIVELQKAKQNFFKERTIYYSTFPKWTTGPLAEGPSLTVLRRRVTFSRTRRRKRIREQAEKGGEWNYPLKAVFCIGILDFTFDDYDNVAERNEVVHVIKLKNQNGKVFYDKLTYIYLEMPNFNKKEEQLESRLDKWLYFIKHLEDFQSIPHIFKGEIIFEKAFEKAELAKFSKSDWDSYENSLKIYRDMKGVIDTARDEGKLEGKLEGKFEVAKALKQNGIPNDIISKTTGLSGSDIDKL